MLNTFKLLKISEISELNIIVYNYQHKITNAQHIHIESKNKENVFLVTFRTIPYDSSGIAHILEHIALCGSKNYPIRDPFFMMLRRSVNTFMNAMTGHDWTGYTFASQNKIDFSNLLKIYLDAAFFPILNYQDFLQEGYRIDIDEKNLKLKYKGVVYNEMKGALSSPIDFIFNKISNYLYPTSTYHYNSGGNPEDIVNLKYNDLLNFYKKYYHPSNSIFFTYGDIPCIEHQEKFEELVLSKYSNKNSPINIKNEIEFNKPEYFTDTYPNKIIKKDNNIHILSWCLGNYSVENVFNNRLIDSILMGNSSSPLLSTLEKSNIGYPLYNAISGLNDQYKMMSFTCGLQGCEFSDAKNIENIVLNKLEYICKTGINNEILKSVFLKMEIEHKEILSSSYPYGLNLFFKILPAVLYNENYDDFLNIMPIINNYIDKIKDNNFIKDLIRSNLLDNNHRILLTLSPDQDFFNNQNIIEEKKLNKIYLEENLEKIKKSILLFNKHQNEEHNINILPKINIDEIEHNILDIKYFKNKNVYYYKKSTNKLLYIDIMYNLPTFSNEEYLWLSFYSFCFGQIGTVNKSYIEINEYQNNYIYDNLNASIFINKSNESFQDNLIISAYTVEKNYDHLLKIMNEIIENSFFYEKDHIDKLMQEMLSLKKENIISNGHFFAMKIAASKVNNFESWNNRYFGLNNLLYLDSQNNINIDILNSIHNKINKQNKYIHILSETELLDKQILSQNNHLISKNYININELSSQKSNYLGTIWVMNIQTNFCAITYPSVTFTHDDAPILCVLAKLLSNKYLHSSIREKGGAYGSGAIQNNFSSIFSLFSYRDPRLEDTLIDFEIAIHAIKLGKFNQNDVEEAILMCISNLDKPLSSVNEMRKSYYNKLNDLSYNNILKYRNFILNVNKNQLIYIANKYLISSLKKIGIITCNENITEDIKHNMEVHEYLN